MFAHVIFPLQIQAKLIFYLQPESLNYKHGLYDSSDIHRIEFLARRILSVHHKDDVIIWDSHLELQRRYAGICREFGWNTPDKKWACDDTTHSGYIVIAHMAKQLLKIVQ